MIARKPDISCDVLVIGGGNAGMMAAIEAADAGANVIIAEKGNTRRSGSAATGNDHFQCYIPEVHGSVREFLDLFMHDRPGGQGGDMDKIMAFTMESPKTVELWHSWGINMKPHGYWEFTGHNLPTVQGTHLKYEGVDQKPILTREALKRGVKILNRHTLAEIILDDEGRVAAGLTIDIFGEQPEVQVINCKAMVLSSARVCARLNGSDRMAWLYNSHYPPNCVGEATAAAYRVGCKLCGGRLEGGDDYYGKVGNSRFLSRGGSRTWVGIHSNVYGEPSTPYQDKPDWRYSCYDEFMGPELQKSYQNGVPVFLNAMDDTDEDLEYMKWALVHEGNGASLSHLEDEGFDFKRHIIEFCQGIEGGGKPGGPDVTPDGETNIVGLYGGGEVTGNNLPGLGPAVISGQFAGRAAAAFSKEHELSTTMNVSKIDECIAQYNTWLDTPCDIETPNWEEANIAIMQTMFAYCGTGVVSEELLMTGISHMRRLQEKIKTLHAGDAHEFMHCLEVAALAQNGELVMLQALDRKETRRSFYGTIRYNGYPEVDHSWDNMIATIQLVDGKPVCGRRPIIREGGEQYATDYQQK